MRLSTLFVLIAAPTLLACSSSSSVKKVTDAATDPAAAADRVTDTTSMSDKDAPIADSAPAKDGGSTDGVRAADSPLARDVAAADAPAADVAIKDGSANDPWSPADLSAADVGSRDGTVVEVLLDVAADAPPGCLGATSVGPPCNDDPASAAVQGVCQSDGTCRCNSGFALNPTTGRCGYRRWDAAAGNEVTTAAMCTGSYDACPCLCCSTDQVTPTCYFPTLGETVDDIRTAYEASRDPANCGAGSCSGNIVRHVCCTPADPEPSSSATYVATGYVGGIDYLSFAKTGANCASLAFSGGVAAKRGFNIDGGGIWTALSGRVGPCGDASAQTEIQGALGTLTIRSEGSDCVADLHATLFAIDSTGAVTTVRMDGDAIQMPRVLSAMSCR